MHKHKANRHTYDVGAAHNDAVLAANFDAGTLDKLDAASGSARECGWLTTLERELADGRLVCPLAASASSDKAYYLIIPERRREAPALQRLREWLLAEAAAYRQAQANAELSA